MSKSESRDDKAEWVREQFPECVAFADKVRDAFGAGTKMIYAKENGREIGRLSDRPGDKNVRGDKLVIESAGSDSVKRNSQGKLVAKHGK